jgi:hypothetical protein
LPHLQMVVKVGVGFQPMFRQFIGDTPILRLRGFA